MVRILGKVLQVSAMLAGADPEIFRRGAPLRNGVTDW